MRRLFAAIALVVLSGLALGGVAAATPTTPTNGPITQPGQHNISCGPDGPAPGGGSSVNSPGSPFAGGTSDSNYAGQKSVNSANGQNSQYDIACFQQVAN
jgi:hypothetical protein